MTAYEVNEFNENAKMEFDRAVALRIRQNTYAAERETILRSLFQGKAVLACIHTAGLVSMTHGEAVKVQRCKSVSDIRETFSDRWMPKTRNNAPVLKPRISGAPLEQQVLNDLQHHYDSSHNVSASDSSGYATNAAIELSRKRQNDGIFVENPKYDPTTKNNLDPTVKLKSLWRCKYSIMWRPNNSLPEDQQYCIATEVA